MPRCHVIRLHADHTTVHTDKIDAVLRTGQDRPLAVAHALSLVLDREIEQPRNEEPVEVVSSWVSNAPNVSHCSCVRPSTMTSKGPSSGNEYVVSAHGLDQPRLPLGHVMRHCPPRALAAEPGGS